MCLYITNVILSAERGYREVNNDCSGLHWLLPLRVGSCLVAVMLLTGSVPLTASLLQLLQLGSFFPLPPPPLGLGELGVLVGESVRSHPLKGNKTELTQ